MAEASFPDPQWGREGLSPWFRPAYTLASTAPGSWFIRRLVPLDRRVMARSNGRFTLFGPTSLPALLLTTTGRKSGQPRETPLSYLRDGDSNSVAGQQLQPTHASGLDCKPAG